MIKTKDVVASYEDCAMTMNEVICYIYELVNHSSANAVCPDLPDYMLQVLFQDVRGEKPPRYVVFRGENPTDETMLSIRNWFRVRGYPVDSAS